MVHARRLLVSIFVSLTFASAAHPQPKSLHYRNLSVEARLDSDGVLHVSERQEIAFTGDWNGGERTFRVELGQHLSLLGISRVVAGRLQPLTEGDLTDVDTYHWADSTTLRWRSRLPGAPPFDNTVITYVIDYTLSNILLTRGDGYLLDHDFAFPDRQGRIEQFSATLTLDPPWKADRPITPMRAAPLEPGRGYVLALPLTYAADGRPAGVLAGASKPFRYALLAVFLGSLVLLSARFYRSESSTGRFMPLTPLSRIDEQWLDENIFRHLPEVVGAAWDGNTGAAEVAAVLARMEAEKKIRSEVKTLKAGRHSKPVLHLALLVDRGTLEGYERKLVNGLFFKGDSTNTESLKAHYANRGFNPADAISDSIDQKVKALANDYGQRPKPSWKVSCLLASLAGLLLVAAFLFRPHEILIAIAPVMGALILYAIAIFAALSWGKRIVRLGAPSLGFVIPLALLAAGTAWNILGESAESSALLLAGSAVLCLAVVNSVLNAARIRQGRELVSVRKKLAASREYFREELLKPQPHLQDQWFPYLVAFGLGNNVEEWFKEHGKAVDRDHSFERGQVGATISSSSTSAGRPAWSGGGGLSGGAGAGRSWAAAAGAIAAGVSSSSSSSGRGSSGGGSSSSGSSGGGGGGGW